MSKALNGIAPFVWGLLVLAGFLAYGSTGHDDPHINFWFAHTLLERGEMVNYNGDRFEQTTSLLLVFLTALFTVFLPFDLVTCGYLVDIACSLACCALLVWVMRRVCPSLLYWPAVLVLGSLSFMVWTFGGMGSVLAACCLLSGVVVWWCYLDAPQLQMRHGFSLAAVTLALVLVRPEMPLIIVAVSVFSLLFHWRDAVKRQRCLHILLACVVGIALLLLWQKLYFSSWLPLPVLAKQSGSFLARLQPGFYYVGIYAVVNPVVAAALLLSLPLLLWLLRGFVLQRGATLVAGSLWVLLCGALLAYAGFVWTAGGDWMQAGRFMVPVIPLSALLVTFAARLLLRHTLLACVALLLLCGYGLQRHPEFITADAIGTPAWARYRMLPEHSRYSIFEQYNQEHLRDMAVIDHLREMIPVLHRQLGRPVRLLSGQGGMVFYRLAEELPGMIQFSDFRGLVEGSLTLCPLLADTRRTAMGLAWNYPDYFALLPDLQQQCGIVPPDVVYDLNDIFNDREPIFAAAGYALVHQEQGFMLINETRLPSNSRFVPNIVFVKKELLPLLDYHGEKRIVDYSVMPLHKRWAYEWFTSPVWRRQ